MASMVFASSPLSAQSRVKLRTNSNYARSSCYVPLHSKTNSYVHLFFNISHIESSKSSFSKGDGFSKFSLLKFSRVASTLSPSLKIIKANMGHIDGDSIHHFNADKLEEKQDSVKPTTIPLSDYTGKVLLIVNIPQQCSEQSESDINYLNELCQKYANVLPTTHVVQFNPAAQLPIKLQGNLNFATWKAQLVMLLNGHKLLGHLNGTKTAPPTTITQNDCSISNPEFETWFCQDQLIQQAMMASVDPTIAPTVATASSAKMAWELLHTTYANRSHTRIFSLRDQLQNLKKASKTVAEYLQEIRSIADALKVAGSPVADDELAVKILSGLGPEYREISAAIRARDSALSFEELFHKLTDHELFLKHQDLEKSSSIITAAVAQRTNFQPQHHKNNRHFPNQSWKSPAQRQRYSGNQQNGRQPRQAVKCQLCQKIGHTADVCRSKSHNHFEAKVNFVSSHQPDASPWILDSGATHHVTTESDNLEEYTGNEEVSMGGGSQNSEAAGTRPEQKWTL